MQCDQILKIIGNKILWKSSPITWWCWVIFWKTAYFGLLLGNIKLLRYSNVWSHCLLSWLSCYRRVSVNPLPPGGCSIRFSFHFKLELCWFDILYLQRRVTNFEQILVCRPRGRAAKYQKSFVDFNLLRISSLSSPFFSCFFILWSKICKWPRNIGTWLIPICLRLLGWSRFKPSLAVNNSMLNTGMLMAGAMIHQHWWPQLKPICIAGGVAVY